MRHRSRVRPSSDISFFSRTAKRTKKVNVRPKVMRGGIRL